MDGQLNCISLIRQTLLTMLILMQTKSIAESSYRSFLQYFWSALAFHLSIWKQIMLFLWAKHVVGKYSWPCRPKV